MEKNDQVNSKESLPSPPRHPQPCIRCLLRTVFIRGICLLILFLIILRGFRYLFSNLHNDSIALEPFGRYGYRHRMSKNESEHWILSVPSFQSANNTASRFSSHPHLAGSEQDFRDARSLLYAFQDEFQIPRPVVEPIYQAGSLQSQHATLGLTSAVRPSAWIDVYYPYLDTPSDRSLQVLDEHGQPVWEADLMEDGDKLDDDAHEHKAAVLPWHGFSWPGEAQGQLIYANYGTQEDYQELLRNGANFTGKIVLVRYGGIYRGLKIKGAQELGAVGVLIYSDPRDDGYVVVSNGFAPYPHGPARNPTSVQRGSSMFLSIYPGDPTTPGYPAYENAERQDPTNVPKIPSLPISWNNAQRLLEEIEDPFTHETVGDGRRSLSGGVSRNVVKIENRVDAKVKPIWNTMASIPGHIRDEVVVFGCHRDAWVLGGADPVSGLVAFNEVIRGFGTLLRKGWRPLRTIVFASWDAEEHGLIGSVEYGEDFASWISEHVVAYINVDSSSAGSRWNVAGSPLLAQLIKQAALDVPHPSGDGRSLWEARDDEGPFAPNDSMTIDKEFLAAYEAETARRRQQQSSTGVARLGSGSDFTVFLQRLGIPSTDEGFGGTPTDAVYHYHSIYDSMRWQEVFADPGFKKHLAVAKHLGLLTLRTTDAITLPLNVSLYAAELDDYLREVEALSPALTTKLSSEFASLRDAIASLQSSASLLEQEKEASERLLRELLDKMPKATFRPSICQRRSVLYEKFANFVKAIFGVPPLNRSNDDDWWDVKLEQVTETPELSKDKSPFPVKEFIRAAKRVRAVNKRLQAFERGFISVDGIKDREWYKHLVVAPGKWLGYGATVFPGLTEAITIENNETLASYEAQRLTDLFNKLAETTNPIQGRIRFCRW